MSVRGKVAPDTVKPAPLTDAELIVTAADPVEVSVTGSVALDPTATLPKLRVVELTDSVRVLEAFVVTPEPLIEPCASAAPEEFIAVNFPE